MRSPRTRCGEVIPTRWKDCAKSCWNSLRSSNWNSTFGGRGRIRRPRATAGGDAADRGAYRRPAQFVHARECHQGGGRRSDHGAPNVGKSTLLNRLLNEERVLVSDIAGTTRDVIEERINIDGVVFRFLDTAGIRATDDRLEQMGIQRTMSSIERAQIVIYMTDAARLAAGAPVAPEFPLRADQKLLVLVNKTDMARTAPCPKARSAFRPATATA